MSVVIAPMHLQKIDSDYYDWIVKQSDPIITIPVEGRFICRGDIIQLERNVAKRSIKKTTADFEIVGITTIGEGDNQRFQMHLMPLAKTNKLF